MEWNNRCIRRTRASLTSARQHPYSGTGQQLQQAMPIERQASSCCSAASCACQFLPEQHQRSQQLQQHAVLASQPATYEIGAMQLQNLQQLCSERNRHKRCTLYLEMALSLANQSLQSSIDALYTANLYSGIDAKVATDALDCAQMHFTATFRRTHLAMQLAAVTGFATQKEQQHKHLERSALMQPASLSKPDNDDEEISSRWRPFC